MKSIEDYNWEDMYIKTHVWMEQEGIPGKVNTGRKSINGEHQIVDIEVPCKGNKSIIDRVSNYRHVGKGIGYISNGIRYCVFRVLFTKDGVMANRR